MKTIQVSEATPLQIDWLVAKCLNLQPLHHYTFDKGHHIVPHPYYEGYDFGFEPSTSWEQAGPIIEREKIELVPSVDGKYWYAESLDRSARIEHCPTPLIAAMRCYITSKLGDTVEVPEELG